MDWKDILAAKLNSGDFPEAESEPTHADNDSTPAPTANTDIIEVCIDRKGRKGKSATIASGFTCDDNELKTIASRLKTSLSTGGSSRGGEILIQGERADDVKRILRELGYKIRK